MKARDFDSSVRSLVGPLVESWGFNCIGGRGCTFHRRIEDNLFHFIFFELRSNGREFEVYVFSGTPLLGAEQWVGFPDFVGIPTSRFAGLNAKQGLGHGPSRFSCKDLPSLQAALSRAVLPALEAHAVQYLSKFRVVANLVPVLEHPQWAALLR